MSVKQMSKVWEKEVSGTRQNMLLALADHAHDDGSNIHPSVAHLAWKTGYSERQVRRILKELAADGTLIQTKKSTGHDPAIWQLNLDNLEDKRPWGEVREEGRRKHAGNGGHPETGQNVTPENPETGHNCVTPRPDITVSDEPSGEPSDIPVGESDDSDDEEKENVEDKDSFSDTSSPAYYLAYLADRLKERELEEAPPGYKKRLGGELRWHLKKGYRSSRLLLAIDHIVFRWPETKLDFHEALKSTDRQVDPKKPTETPRPRKRVI